MVSIDLKEALRSPTIDVKKQLAKHEMESAYIICHMLFRHNLTWAAEEKERWNFHITMIYRFSSQACQRCHFSIFSLQDVLLLLIRIFSFIISLVWSKLMFFVFNVQHDVSQTFMKTIGHSRLHARDSEVPFLNSHNLLASKVFTHVINIHVCNAQQQWQFIQNEGRKLNFNNILDTLDCVIDIFSALLSTVLNWVNFELQVEFQSDGVDLKVRHIWISLHMRGI